jgi:Asp-tRNA(Asn)/Glu-tRNA(Gln) amidotransferase A subunit family amidase
MGSVRIPASYSGVVGFKPSSAINSNKHLILLSQTYDTIGFHSNNINNINSLFNIIKPKINK